MRCLVGGLCWWGKEVVWITAYGGVDRLGEVGGMNWCWLVDNCFSPIYLY